MDDKVRLIDANALKETLEDLCSGSDRVTVRRIEDCMLHDIFPRIIDDEPTIEAEPVNGWINVKDRLPKTKMDHVLFTLYTPAWHDITDELPEDERDFPEEYVTVCGWFDVHDNGAKRYWSWISSDGYQSTMYGAGDRAAWLDECITTAHAFDAEPVKHGRWIYGENDDGQDGIFCSECEHFVPWFHEYYDKSDDLINDNPRCPNCGCKQDLEGGDING